MIKRRLFFFALLMFSILTPTTSDASEPIDIGSRRELFVDHYLIDQLNGVALKLHSPQSKGPAIRFDKPWEGKYSAIFSMFQDGDIYRMYYRANSDVGLEHWCYAESKDGVEWTRPNLGLHEFNGSLGNNILFSSNGDGHISPFLDTRPGVPADQRYKALTLPNLFELKILVSADGIHWRDFHPDSVIKYPRQGIHVFDTVSVCFWSETENCYVLYTRWWDENPDKVQGHDVAPRTRQIRRHASDDLIHWSPPQYMTYGDTTMEELYTNATKPYFRAPHIYLSFPKRYFPGRNSRSDADFKAAGLPTWNKGVSDAVFMSTRGGTKYDRTFMEAFIRPGPDKNNWFGRTQSIAPVVIPTGPNEISLYCSRHYSLPTVYIERMTLRTDGFVSVNAPYKGGSLLTKPLIFQGDKLELNYSTSAAGSMQVEILAADGADDQKALAKSKPLICDEIDGPVSWQDDANLAALARKAVRLRFVMKDADLYSFCFLGGLRRSDSGDNNNGSESSQALLHP